MLYCSSNFNGTMIRKCLFICTLSVLTLQTAYSQKKKNRKNAPPPVPEAPALRSQLDTVSYTIGNDMGNMLKNQGLDSIDLKMLFMAIEDVYKNNKPLITTDQGSMNVSEYLQKLKAEKAARNKAAGEQFLAENKTKPGVITLPSGLQYQVITEGTGPKPGASDKVKVHYVGTLVDGSKFDSSIDRGNPLSISVANVIKGWTEALLLMPQGSKWKLFIPSALGYGEQQAGPKIGPNSALVFEVELLGIESK